MKAIAQFERTMLSANSKYDKYQLGQATLTATETRGMNLLPIRQKVIVTIAISLEALLQILNTEIMVWILFLLTVAGQG